MVLIFALLAINPVFVCGGDRICTAANELRGQYAAWTEVVNKIPPGGFDAREKQRWNTVQKAFKRLDNARKEMGW